MYCGNCGSQISEGSKFCPKCGKTVDLFTNDKNNVNQDQPINGNIQNQNINSTSDYQEQNDDQTKPKKRKKPIKWIIISGVSLVLVAAILFVIFGLIVPSSVTFQNRNSVLSDTTAVEYYFTNNLKKSKNELKKCRYYDLMFENDGWGALLVQYNNNEYYLFRSYGDLSGTWYSREHLASETGEYTLPMTYKTEVVSTDQKKNYKITELNVTIPEASFSDTYSSKLSLYISCNTDSGCVERVMLGNDKRFSIWMFQYNDKNYANKVSTTMIKNKDPENKGLINPEISNDEILSKCGNRSTDYFYEYNEDYDLIKTRFKEPSDEYEYSYTYNSNKSRETLSITYDYQKLVYNYTRDEKGTLISINMIYYTNDSTDIENDYVFDFRFDNDNINISYRKNK